MALASSSSTTSWQHVVDGYLVNALENGDSWMDGMVAAMPLAHATSCRPSRLSSRSCLIRTVATLLPLLCQPLLTGADDLTGDDADNDGEDVTRPLDRLDLRYQLKNAPGPGGYDNILITRGEGVVHLTPTFAFDARVDVPVNISNVPAADDPGGNVEVGFGDVLTQAIVDKALSQRWAVGMGTQFVLPTATYDSMGTGHFRLLPTLAISCSMPALSEGSWTGLIGRWNVSFGGDSSRKDINELQAAPQFNIELPHDCYVLLFPSTDLRYNLEPVPAGDTGRWFVPLDVAIGTRCIASTVLSAEVSVPVIEQYHVYDFKLELRAGYLF